MRIETKKLDKLLYVCYIMQKELWNSDPLRKNGSLLQSLFFCICPGVPVLL